MTRGVRAHLLVSGALSWPPEYPTAVEVTPFTFAKASSTPQKRPAPKIAVSMRTFGFFSSKIRDAELMQKRSPVGAGPSRKDMTKGGCRNARSEFHCAPCRGRVRLRANVLVGDRLKEAWPARSSQTWHPSERGDRSLRTNRHLPGGCRGKSQKGRSVPCARATLYCSGVSCARHCSSVLDDSRHACWIGKGSVGLQKRTLTFSELILHGLRFSSAGLVGGKDDDRPRWPRP